MPVVSVMPIRIRIRRVAVALEDLRIRCGRGQHMVPLQIQFVVPMVGTDLLLVVVWISAQTRADAASHADRPESLTSQQSTGSTSAATAATDSA